MTTLKGYGCTVDWDGGRLTITANNKAAKVALLGEDWERGSVTLPREQIESVSCKKGIPVVSNGALKVFAKDGRKFVAHYLNKADAEFQALAAQLS
jgi:hypothetical protein